MAITKTSKAGTIEVVARPPHSAEDAELLRRCQQRLPHVTGDVEYAVRCELHKMALLRAAYRAGVRVLGDAQPQHLKARINCTVRRLECFAGALGLWVPKPGDPVRGKCG